MTPTCPECGCVQGIHAMSCMTSLKVCRAFLEIETPDAVYTVRVREGETDLSEETY